MPNITSTMNNRTRIVSHRGAAGLAPENTLASIRAALQYDVPLIEVDVRRTADGHLVLIHDATVDRTTNGNGRAREFTLSELRRLDAGSWFSPDFADERIPTLEEALRLVQPTDATLVIEGKDPERYPGIATQLIETIRQLDAAADVMIVSFDHEWLQRVQALAPTIPLGAISLWATGVPAFETAAVATSWPSAVLTPWLARRIHTHGCQLWVWTVDAPWLMRLMCLLGVDVITTNRPDRWMDAAGKME